MDLIKFENDIFTMNTMFGDIRGKREQGDNLWFILKDALDSLGLSKSGFHKTRLSDEGVKKNFIPTAGGPQEMIMINEANFYRLVCRSNKPKAREFEKQVFEVILPSIRRTGSYSVQPQLSPPAPGTMSIVPKSFAEALELAAKLEREREQLSNKNQELEQINQTMLPAYNWVSRIREAGVIWDYTEASAVLAIKDLGPIQLREYLVKNKWLYDRDAVSNRTRRANGKKSRYDWTPYSEIVQAGYMKKDLRVYNHDNGNIPSFIDNYMPSVILIDGMLKLNDMLKDDGYVSTTKQHQEKAKRIIEWALRSMKADAA